MLAMAEEAEDCFAVLAVTEGGRVLRCIRNDNYRKASFHRRQRKRGRLMLNLLGEIKGGCRKHKVKGGTFSKHAFDPNSPTMGLYNVARDG